jgi:hypothetical protein
MNPPGVNRISHRLLSLAPIVCLLAAAPLSAWDEEGHTLVTLLAIEKIPESMPDWLNTPSVRDRLVYLASEPDRWRGQHSVQVDHANSPDHYIDEELLRPYGLSIKTLPLFRREFTDILAAQRAVTPQRFKPYHRKKDRAYTRLSPGMLPYRIAELQWTIAASWTTLKTYEKHRDCVSDEMIENARANVVFHMGLLSHYIGDGAQPLHTTEHYNGWTGPNPHGYTTDKSFHEFIDSGAIAQFDITPASLVHRARPPRKISTEEYWRQICAYLYETHELAEPLYILEKAGDLYKPTGKRFIEDRLLQGGAMLAGVWIAAYQGAVIDDFRARQLKAKKKAASSNLDRAPGGATGSRRAGSLDRALSPAHRGPLHSLLIAGCVTVGSDTPSHSGTPTIDSTRPSRTPGAGGYGSGPVNSRAAASAASARSSRPALRKATAQPRSNSTRVKRTASAACPRVAGSLSSNHDSTRAPSLRQIANAAT